MEAAGDQAGTESWAHNLEDVEGQYEHSFLKSSQYEQPLNVSEKEGA